MKLLVLCCAIPYVAEIPTKIHPCLKMNFESCSRPAAAAASVNDPGVPGVVVQKKPLFATFLITRDIVYDLQPTYLPNTYRSSKERVAVMSGRGRGWAETRKRLCLSSSIHGKESRWFRMIPFVHKSALSGRCISRNAIGARSARSHTI